MIDIIVDGGLVFGVLKYIVNGDMVDFVFCYFGKFLVIFGDVS